MTLPGLLLYRLILEALTRVETSGLSRREIIRRPGASASQFYCLLDLANPSKSVDELGALLEVLDGHVNLVMRDPAHDHSA